MLTQSLRVLAIIVIAFNGVEVLGHHHSFGTDQRSLQKLDETETPWLDVQVPRWLNPFRSLHWRHRFARILLRIAGHNTDSQGEYSRDISPSCFGNDLQITHEIPPYVFDYAPLVHLYSQEKFWPCDIAKHLHHVTPELDYTPIYSQITSLNLTNLDELNEWGRGRHVYLTSNDDVEDMPEWLSGKENIPDVSDISKVLCANHEKDTDCLTALGSDSFLRDSSSIHSPPSNRKLPLSSSFRDTGRETNQRKRKGHRRGGRSKAPAILICVRKNDEIVDAFWFFFYGFNLGNKVFNVGFGNHVGDWEHTLVRFQNGVPKYVFFSEHNFGSAYGFGAVEKIGKRVS